jgi:TRAP-type mannitol/chloroaromatic compound transport system permease large subunit
MSFPLFITLLVFILIFVLRMPIALGMLASAACYLLVKGADLSLVVNQVMNTYYTNYVIIAVPLFNLHCKRHEQRQGHGHDLQVLRRLTGRMRGALGQVNVLASLIFSGMTGLGDRRCRRPWKD